MNLLRVCGYVAILQLSGLAIGQSTDATATAPATTAAPLVKLSVMAEKVEFPQKQDIQLTVTVQNDSTEDLKFGSVATVLDYSITVIDEHGNQAKELPAKRDALRDETGGTMGLVGARGGKLPDEIVISRYFDLRTPGTYSIEFRRTVSDVKGKSYDLVSNKLKITVKKPE